MIGSEPFQRLQRFQVHQLPAWPCQVGGARIEPGREITGALDGVGWEQDLRQLPPVEPSVRSVLKSPVVEIEPVNVNVGPGQGAPPPKTETASLGGLDPTGEAIGVVQEAYAIFGIRAISFVEVLSHVARDRLPQAMPPDRSCFSSATKAWTYPWAMTQR